MCYGDQRAYIADWLALDKAEGLKDVDDNQ